ncbi:LysR family transcriptional regulator [Pollutimonas bauzanensis]|uniref:LysR family transcriptional regulator n=1 Tax=Pollutimonas bauzanensis TaxID=658167 RepID=UPI00333FEC96
MKLAWIEDFLTLVDAGTFSRAAILRNVTQPAFSRRIQLLEAWLNVELIDRRSQPMRLTPLAERRIPEFRALLHNVNHLRNRIQSDNNGMVRVVLATQHSLTITKLPALLQLLNQDPSANIEFNVHSENRDECVALFMRGQSDLLLCMEEEDDRLRNRMPEADRLFLGHETLLPVSALKQDGTPLHAPRTGHILKLLAFPMDSFLGRIMYKHSVNALLRGYQVEVVHESVFLAGVKEMVMAGLGMAWLPESLIKRELESGTLAVLNKGLKSVSLELGLYRSAQSHCPDAIDRLWALLQAGGVEPDAA